MIKQVADGRFVTYIHHGAEVWVEADNMGRHREVCLCFRCENFRPGSPTNCPIAQENYELCVKNDTVQPVWECPAFVYSKEVEESYT